MRDSIRYRKRARQCDCIICNKRAAEWNRNNLWERAMFGNRTMPQKRAAISDGTTIPERAIYYDRSIPKERTNERT